MQLTSRSLPCIGAAAFCEALRGTMSSSSFRTRGRNQWRRGYCNRASTGGHGGVDEVGAFVSGDSQIGDVRAANYGHRQGYPRDGWNYRGAQQQQFRPWRSSPASYPMGPPPKPADYRNWIFAASQPHLDCERFKILSYNILADYLAIDHQSILYFHIPNYILDWEWRKKRLFIEFGLWSPDIMCLQEVDRFCDLEGELAVRGYAGIWKMRTGNAADGCATFWRANRFWLRHEEDIEFSKLGLRDNVAQICVLESKKQYLGENVSAAVPASIDQSNGANQVIVCNIHVLYNPKRGEIKLGQVRVLLDQAYALSRVWNDAPVIVCGDFNSTPMSPLYKFIATQKLDLSGLTRDKISGQYSATLQFSGYSSYKAQPSSHNSSESAFVAQQGSYKTRSYYQNNTIIEKSPAAVYPDAQQHNDGQMSSGATAIKLGEAENFNNDACESSSTHLKLANMSSRTSEICSQQSISFVNGEDGRNPEEAQNVSFDGKPYSFGAQRRVSETLIDTADHIQNNFGESCSEDLKVSTGCGDLVDEIEPTSTSYMDNLTASPLHENENVHDLQKEGHNIGRASSFQGNKDDFFTMASHEALSSDSILVNKILQVDKADDTLSEDKSVTCAGLEVLTVENTKNSSSGSAVVEKAGLLTTCYSGEENGLDISNFDVNNRMDVISHLKDEKTMDYMKSSGENKKVASGKSIQEMSALYDSLSGHATSAEDGHSSELSGSEENADPNFLKELLGMEVKNETMINFYSPNAELQEDSFPLASASSNVEEHFYNPYCWTPVELEIASGKANCTVIEHPLKLRSAYTDVEDYTGTKDSCQEPQVTSYNRRFMGTVDYIWCTEDLQTVKVLDTIPKHVLQRTPGFPTQKWGSDHIALACELAFPRSSKRK